MTERKFNLPNLPKISWTWAEGQYWDLWMVIHLFIGALFGIFFEILQTGFFLGFTSILVVLVVWEIMSSKKLGIRESTENKIIDSVVALCGFGLTYVLAIPFDPVITIPIGLVIVATIALLDFQGWKAYRVNGKKVKAGMVRASASKA